ncbi:MAG: hypothetical protein KDA49_09290, partial [Rhodospirillaceae bacterium]|nr:hypothetical protein [Rhodospirillaceae bacterium]
MSIAITPETTSYARCGPPLAVAPSPLRAETEAPQPAAAVSAAGSGEGARPAATVSGAPRLAPATAVAAQEAGGQASGQTGGQAGEPGPGGEAKSGPAQAPGEAPGQQSSQATDETDASGLTEEEQAEVDALKERDAEVRRHEQAHAAAGGAYAGQPTYEYQTGPDGNRYAVGGEVNIDVA